VPVGLSNASSAGITPQGDPASGASTDSVVVACTLRGAELSCAGPAATLGWLVARTLRAAITRLCREKAERDGGRRVGW
jgi:adenosylcobinamide amidohydrolase